MSPEDLSSSSLADVDSDMARVIDPVDIPVNNEGASDIVSGVLAPGTISRNDSVVSETPDANLDISLPLIEPSQDAGGIKAFGEESPEELDDAKDVEASLIIIPVTPSTVRTGSAPPSPGKRLRSSERQYPTHRVTMLVADPMLFRSRISKASTPSFYRR